MFETAAISYGPASRRVWTYCLGMTGQIIALACAVALPLISPAVLPKTQALMAWIEAPAPPPPTPPRPEVQTTVVRVRNPFQIVGGTLYRPDAVPTGIARIEDPPLPPDGVYADAHSVGTGILELMNGVLATGPTGPKAAPVAAAAPAPPAIATPRRFKSGGNVKPAVLVRRVDPVYPPLARQARVEGVVDLEAVIGIDGRIHELTVKSGHPMLAPAAAEAVRQWLYQPTFLNGDPIEIVQPIKVTFRLN